jgi:hypothetical protein
LRGGGFSTAVFEVEKGVTRTLAVIDRLDECVAVLPTFERFQAVWF